MAHFSDIVIDSSADVSGALSKLNSKLRGCFKRVSDKSYIYANVTIIMRNKRIKLIYSNDIIDELSPISADINTIREYILYRGLGAIHASAMIIPARWLRVRKNGAIIASSTKVGSLKTRDLFSNIIPSVLKKYTWDASIPEEIPCGITSLVYKPIFTEIIMTIDGESYYIKYNVKKQFAICVDSPPTKDQLISNPRRVYYVFNDKYYN